MPPPEQARWFSETVQPHEPALRAYLLKRFPSLPDHDDVVQETFLRMLGTQEKVREGCAKAYLFAIARNTAIDLFRRRRASPCEESAELEELPAAADTPDAAAILDASHQQQTLFEAVSALPPRCREVMMLRYIEGLAAREIAVRLGLALPTVKVHLVKGVRDCARFFVRQGLLEERTPSAQEESA
jgi:RNA polymerase sigma-70 factor (ECF subfamily)